MGPPEANVPKKWLVAFDFDHTVVDGNSDTWIYKALPDGKLPTEVSSQLVKGKWTAFMGLVFRHLHEQRISKQQLEECLASIPLTPGMEELLQYLGSRPDLYDCIIASDANTWFIEHICQAKGLGMFSQVYSNPARFDEGGLLHITPHHSHSCTTCSTNMCKKAIVAKVLQERAQQGVQYAGIAYLGDGQNDLCPSTALEPHHVVFPRYGFMLHKLLLQQSKESALKAAAGAAKPGDHESAYKELQDDYTVKAQVVLWESATTVMDWLKQNAELSA